jgi:hypothetical protein
LIENLIRLGIVAGFFLLVIALPGLVGLVAHLIVKGFLVGWAGP